MSKSNSCEKVFHIFYVHVNKHNYCNINIKQNSIIQRFNLCFEGEIRINNKHTVAHFKRSVIRLYSKQLRKESRAQIIEHWSNLIQSTEALKTDLKSSTYFSKWINSKLKKFRFGLVFGKKDSCLIDLSERNRDPIDSILTLCKHDDKHRQVAQIFFIPDMKDTALQRCFISKLPLYTADPNVTHLITTKNLGINESSIEWNDFDCQIMEYVYLYSNYIGDFELTSAGVHKCFVSVIDEIMCIASYLLAESSTILQIFRHLVYFKNQLLPQFDIKTLQDIDTRDGCANHHDVSRWTETLRGCVILNMYDHLHARNFDAWLLWNYLVEIDYCLLIQNVDIVNHLCTNDDTLLLATQYLFCIIWKSTCTQQQFMHNINLNSITTLKTLRFVVFFINLLMLFCKNLSKKGAKTLEIILNRIESHYIPNVQISESKDSTTLPDQQPAKSEDHKIYLKKQLIMTWIIFRLKALKYSDYVNQSKFGARQKRKLSKAKVSKFQEKLSYLNQKFIHIIGLHFLKDAGHSSQQLDELTNSFFLEHRKKIMDHITWVQFLHGHIKITPQIGVCPLNTTTPNVRMTIEKHVHKKRTHQWKPVGSREYKSTSKYLIKRFNFVYHQCSMFSDKANEKNQNATNVLETLAGCLGLTTMNPIDCINNIQFIIDHHSKNNIHDQLRLNCNNLKQVLELWKNLASFRQCCCCNRKDCKLKRCKTCKRYFCSRFCQKRDWGTNFTHRQQCHSTLLH